MSPKLIMLIRHCSLTFSTGLLLLALAGCSSEAIERAFSADPNASQWGDATQLPKGFPKTLRYPNAQLQSSSDQRQANQTSPQLPLRQTRWQTSDTQEKVQQFYQDLFQKEDWRLIDQASTQTQTVLTARSRTLQVKVTIGRSSEASTPLLANTTQLQIDYGPTSEKSASASPAPDAPVAKKNQPSPPSEKNQQLATVSSFGDLEQVPAELQSYIRDLARLEVLTRTTAPAEENFGQPQFAPNQNISRGLFARWLVEANNRIYRDRPTLQIRLAPTTTSPAFQDVPASDPLFPYIQGLADAGYIPSQLTGESQTTFQPQQPLTRETLLTWKVPVDRRQILPSTTAAKVQQTWGFKDASRISPQALTAILADHANGDLANIRRLLGSTLLFQPQKPVTRAEAAATLWFIGKEGEGFSAKDVVRAERQASSAAPNASAE